VALVGAGVPGMPTYIAETQAGPAQAGPAQAGPAQLVPGTPPREGARQALARSGWTDGALEVVGGPVLAGGKVLVLVVTSSRRLQMDAVDPATGRVDWSVEFGVSEMPPAVAFSPVAIDGTALALVPADGNPSDPAVVLKGVDISSGKVVWHEKQVPIVTGAPTTCVGGRDFCVAAFAPNGRSTSLEVIDPANGRAVRSVAGPARSMEVAETGQMPASDLWMTYSETPDLVQLSASGGTQWQRSVTGLFGGRQYSPNDGWDFSVRHGADVGSVGYPPSGDRLPLAGFKTVAISESGGNVEWEHPGFYMCGGTLGFLSTDVVCNYSGTAVQSKKSVSFQGLGLTLEGLNSSSGKLTWSRRLKDAQSLVEDDQQPFVDNEHFVVQVPDGRSEILDTLSGALAPVARGEVFWCEQMPYFVVTAPEGASSDGARVSEGRFSGCSASGAPVASLPSSQPPTVGVKADGLFIWPGLTGLVASPAR